MLATPTLTNSNGVTHALRCFEADHAENTLGVHTTPAGSVEGWHLDEEGHRVSTGEIPYLQGKVDEFVQAIGSARNPDLDNIWLAVLTTIMKTLRNV